MRIWFFEGMSAVAGTILISMFLLAAAFALEQRQHAYSEYTFWYGGAFGDGHAFANALDARNYQFENGYERLIYWRDPFAVRWVFDATSAPVGDLGTGNGHRVYSYSVGGSPIGAQVNFVHFRHRTIPHEWWRLFLYFNRRMFGQRTSTSQLNLVAECSYSRTTATPRLTGIQDWLIQLNG